MAKTTGLRDALTGAPLRLSPGSVILRVQDLDPRAMPIVIDRREAYHVDGGAPAGASRNYAGGLEWSGDFERYIRKALPRSIEEAKRAWEEWWTLPVVLQRLHVHMGSERLQAALLWHRDRVNHYTIAQLMRHSPEWVLRAQSRATRLVRERYLPYSYRGRYLADFAASLAS